MSTCVSLDQPLKSEKLLALLDSSEGRLAPLAVIVFGNLAVPIKDMRYVGGLSICAKWTADKLSRIVW